MSSLSVSQLILDICQQYIIYVSFVIVIVGMIGNFLNIIVFINMKLFRGNQCIFYLFVESISNIGQLIVILASRILLVLYGSDLSQYSLIWCKIRAILLQVFLLLSITTICFTAFDQFLSTSYLFYLRQMSTLKLSRRLVIIGICFSLSHSILCGLLYDYKPLIACGIYNPKLIQYFSYFFFPVLSGFLPILITSSFSLIAYRNVRHIIRRQIPIVRRRLDRQLTAMVLVRVVLFIICKTPFAIYRIYSTNITINPTDSLRLAIEKMISAVINSVLNLDYATNFYIFLAASPRYRRQVKYVLIKKCWQKWKRWFHSNRNQVNPEIAVQPISSFELE